MAASQITRINGPGKKQLEKALKSLKNADASVGWFPSAKYSNGIPVAYVAYINEHGYPPKNIPARSFMQPTINKYKEEWKGLIHSGAKAIIAGNQTTITVLNQIGSLAVGQIQKTISEVTQPALKPATIKARLRQRADKKTVGLLTKPLEDTKTMYSTVSYTIGD